MMQECHKWKKYFTTSDYNKFTNNISDAKIKEKSLLMNLIFQDS